MIKFPVNGTNRYQHILLYLFYLSCTIVQFLLYLNLTIILDLVFDVMHY